MASKLTATAAVATASVASNRSLKAVLKRHGCATGGDETDGECSVLMKILTKKVTVLGKALPGKPRTVF
jgi:hypothetical protein